MTEQEKYLEGHRNCGISVGDKVRVTRKAESRKAGWDNWWEEGMDEFVGETVIVLVDWEKSICRRRLWGYGLRSRD